MQSNEKLKTQEKELEAESEELHFDKADFSFIPSNCQYRQEGPYLVCRSCELHHAVFIGMEKMMVGVSSNGQPILKNRDF